MHFQSALASYYDEGPDGTANDNVAQASAVPKPKAASSRDEPMASVSNFKPAAKPKKWQPQTNR